MFPPFPRRPFMGGLTAFLPLMLRRFFSRKHRWQWFLLASLVLLSGCALAPVFTLPSWITFVIGVVLFLAGCSSGGGSSAAGEGEVSINNVAVGEGAGTADFKVTRGGTGATLASVQYTVSGGTAKAGDDFVADPGLVTFKAGELEKTLSVEIKDDSTIEGAETFKVTLASPIAATILDGEGVGTIIDDDLTATFPDVSVEEGAGSADFTITLSDPLKVEATVDYATVDGTALAGTDYVAATGTLTFAAGETEKTFSVTITDNAVFEDDKTFTVELSNPAASGFTLPGDFASATGTIENDDSPPTLSVDNVSVDEDAGTATFTVTKTGETVFPASVDYATADDTAKADSDYTAASGTLDFAVEDTQKTFTVPILPDNAFEGAETFTVALSNPSGATVDAPGIGTIVSNDETSLALVDLGDAGFFMSGVNSGDYAGHAVGGAGDLNGDGFADVIVGAPGFSSTNPYEGKSYVLFGKSSGQADISLSTVTGGTIGFNAGPTSDAFAVQNGRVVGSAGDVNGDGYGDLLIGEPFNYYNDGKGYLVFGKATGFTDLDLASLGSGGITLNPTFQTNRKLALAMAAAGDVNADGLKDFIVGAPDTLTATSVEGRSYVILGKSSGLADMTLDTNLSSAGKGFNLNGTVANARSGTAVGAVDFNGDGLTDLIVGAPYQDASAGKVYVVFGREFSSTPADVTLDDFMTPSTGVTILGGGTANPSARAGQAVSGAGDVNGDGLGDVLIGAPSADSGLPISSTNEGKAYIVFGKSTSSGNITLSDDLTGVGVALNGEAIFDYAGTHVSGVGDLDGDGYDDVIVSRIGSGCNPSGKAYVVFGKADWSATISIDLGALTSEDGFPIIGSRADGRQVDSLAAAGDVNGDGFADLIIGGKYSAVDPQNPYTREGKAFVIYGGDFRGKVTHLGTTGDDTLTGTTGADVMVGGRGNDTLVGGGGADALQGGSGDDVLAVGDTGFLRVDGGSGKDTLRLDGGSLTLDLSLAGAGAGTKLRNLEIIDLTGSGNNTLTLTAGAVSLLSGGVTALPSGAKGHLVIKGDAGDVVNLTGGVQNWTAGADETVDGVAYKTYLNGTFLRVIVHPDITVNNILAPS